MKYNVHIYVVVRIKVSNVEAKDPSEAAEVDVNSIAIDQQDRDGNVVWPIFSTDATQEMRCECGEPILVY